MEHHSLDIAPVPGEKEPMYINEPWLIDLSLLESPLRKEPEEQPDNIRVYIPMDINRKAIMRRLNYIVSKYGEATEDNEFNFSQEVDTLISQIEIYDQVWFVRHAPKE